MGDETTIDGRSSIICRRNKKPARSPIHMLDGNMWRLVASFLLKGERWRLARTCWRLRGHPMTRAGDSWPGALSWPMYRQSLKQPGFSPPHVTWKVALPAMWTAARKVAQQQIHGNDALVDAFMRHNFESRDTHATMCRCNAVDELRHLACFVPAKQWPHIQWNSAFMDRIDSKSQFQLAQQKVRKGWYFPRLIETVKWTKVILRGTPVADIMFFFVDGIEHGWEYWNHRLDATTSPFTELALAFLGQLPAKLETAFVDNTLFFVQQWVRARRPMDDCRLLIQMLPRDRQIQLRRAADQSKFIDLTRRIGVLFADDINNAVSFD
jgi:hypothetical protein